MWRLLGGELLWALRQLAARPWTAFGLVGGFVATFSILSAIAPGPIVDPPWRLLMALASGLVIAAGVRELEPARGRPADMTVRDEVDEQLPLVGATVVCAGATVAVLIAWLAVWAAQTLR